MLFFSTEDLFFLSLANCFFLITGPAVPVEEAMYHVDKSRQVALLTSTATQELGVALSRAISGRGKGNNKLPCLNVAQHLQSSPLSPTEIHISSGRYLNDNDAGVVSEYSLRHRFH